MKQNDIKNAVTDASFASFHLFQNRNKLAQQNHDEYSNKPSNADPDFDSDGAMYMKHQNQILGLWIHISYPLLIYSKYFIMKEYIQCLILDTKYQHYQTVVKSSHTK